MGVALLSQACLEEDPFSAQFKTLFDYIYIYKIEKDLHAQVTHSAHGMYIHIADKKKTPSLSLSLTLLQTIIQLHPFPRLDLLFPELDSIANN